MPLNELAATRKPHRLMRLFELFLADSPGELEALGVQLRRACNEVDEFKDICGAALRQLPWNELEVVLSTLRANNAAFFLRLCGSSTQEKLAQHAPLLAAKLQAVFTRSPRAGRREFERMDSK